MTADLERPERLQIMLNAEELAAVDDFRFQKRMPSRAAAVRELMRRGLSAVGFSVATSGVRSTSFGVLGADSDKGRKGKGADDYGNATVRDSGASEQRPTNGRSNT